MAERKIITVIGATGAQGGGLVRAILDESEGDFAVRAVTRNKSSDSAQELAGLGAEVVEADINDEKSILDTFSGAWGAYCVTFFWEHFDPEKEMAQAGNMARAAENAGLHHVIWSTLEDTRKWVPLDDDRMPTLKEKYKVPHFDAKGMADSLFTERGLPVTLLLTSFYWDNFIHFGMGPKAGPDGRLAITLPIGEARLPGIATEDIGRCALGIFKRGGELQGKTVGVAGEHLTGHQMAESLGRALGKEIVYNSVEPEVFRGFGFPGADDLGNMFQFKRDFKEYFCGARDPEFARSLNPELKTFDKWLAINADRIPME